MVEENGKTGRIDRTLLELVTGILVTGILGQAGAFFVERKLYYTLGWWSGILIAIFVAWHMWRTLDKGLDLGEAGAPKYLASANIIRYVIVAVAYIAVAVLDFGNPIATFFGILMLKVAAYIQPYTHKIFTKLFGWEEVFPPGIPDEEETESTDSF